MLRYQLSYGLKEGEKPPEIPLFLPPPQHDRPGKSDLNPPAEKKKKPNNPEWFEEEDSKMTKVYVSNLPTDITDEEFIEIMSKYGLIMKDEQNKYKIKLYADSDGKKKGDGLCTYIKVESVSLALQILDGSDVRGNTITVEKAKFELKGAYDPSKKPRQKKKKDKLKIKEKQERLFEWKPEKLRGERPKHEKIVIVKNAFQPSDFDNEVELLLEYQQDFREEANKRGTCKKVTVYDRHPEGVIQINMSTHEEADQVVNLFNGRFFGGRKIEATLHDGKAKYRIEETDEEQRERQKKWDSFVAEDNAEGESNLQKTSGNSNNGQSV